MTEDELSELAAALRSEVPTTRRTAHGAADAIESLRASLANAERRAEDAEARNVFLETEFLALAEKVKK